MSKNYAPHYYGTNLNHVIFRTSVPGRQSAGVEGPVSYDGQNYAGFFAALSHRAAASTNGFFGPPGTVSGGFAGPGGGPNFHRTSYSPVFKMKPGETLPGVFSLSSSGTITYDPAKNVAFDEVTADIYTILATYYASAGFGGMKSHTWTLRVVIGVQADGPPRTDPVEPTDPGHPDHGHPSDPTGGGTKPPKRDPPTDPADPADPDPVQPATNANPNVRMYAGVLQSEPASKKLLNLTKEEAAEFLPSYASDSVFDVKVHDPHPLLRVAHAPKVVSTNFGTRADIHYTLPNTSRNDLSIDADTGFLSYRGGHGDAEQKTQIEVTARCHYQVGAKHYTVCSVTPVTLQVEGADNPAAAPVPDPAPADAGAPSTSTHPAHTKSTEHKTGEGLQWYAYAGISVGVLVLAALVAWAVIRRRGRA